MNFRKKPSFQRQKLGFSPRRFSAGNTVPFPTPYMNPLRHATYTLLSRLFLAPPDERLLTQLSKLPPFDALVNEATIDEALVETYQVAYQALFGINVFPYESLFHERELMVNSGSAGRVAQLMQQSGFESDGYRVGAADHIGVELAFMAHLITLERSAAQRQHLEMVHLARQHQSTLIHHHLATWVPVAMLSIQSIAPLPLFRLMAELTTELILLDVTEIPAPGEIFWLERETPSEPATDTGEEEGLGEWIRQLITPSLSGLFLTRAEIRAIARQVQLPTTMGDRFGMLKQLFEAAGQFEQIPLLLTALASRWDRAGNDINALVQTAPAWEPYGRQWLARIQQGQLLIEYLYTTWHESLTGNV